MKTHTFCPLPLSTPPPLQKTLLQATIPVRLDGCCRLVDYVLCVRDPRIAELREMPLSFSIKLHSKTQVSGSLGMFRGISPRHAQNPLSGERRKMLSITHHALSPPPSHHHLYIISSHQLTTTFLSYYNVT